ncbi:HyuE hydantoin racemase [Salipiger pallidus]|uniref:HyuE hydantoin racemase n=1 Tax=Salipiger pallidus TaxID=1775170 RepID=A0A8J2ZKQ5_9RHOB|nr:aspartate/glutamate racemase family protein [Salipiger pallidus]GGG74902.1 HyuE hydantoin racemase [Salipiger pallidus]
MILFLNPNSSEHMTDGIVATAREVLPGVRIEGRTNHGAPAAIQGAEDGAAAVPGLLAQVETARDAEVIVIACFDDTGLAEMRARAHCPVIGIGQAAFHAASLLGERFSVLTTLPVSLPVIEGNIQEQGFAQACIEVRPSGIPVLEVEAGGTEVIARLREGIAALTDGGADAVVLGCAGMCIHRDALREGIGAHVVDGVRAAALLADVLRRV